MKNEKYCAAVASVSWLTDAAYPLRVHTVFLRFSNLDLTKNLSPNLLAKLCGAALILIRKASPEGAACFVIYKERNHKTSLI